MLWPAAFKSSQKSGRARGCKGWRVANGGITCDMIMRMQRVVLLPLLDASVMSSWWEHAGGYDNLLHVAAD